MVLVLKNQLFCGTVDEITDDCVDGATVPFDHDPSLSGGHEFGIVTGPSQREAYLETYDQFANVAVVPHRVNAKTPLVDLLPLGQGSLGSLTHIDNARS